MLKQELIKEKNKTQSNHNICADFDEDCKDVPGITPSGNIRSYHTCWMHNPSTGYCPFIHNCN